VADHHGAHSMQGILAPHELVKRRGSVPG
jgi:hypothetical protein